MIDPPRDTKESLDAPSRLAVINEIAGGHTPIPFVNISIGERASDEPTQLDIFAMYFPCSNRNYELISVTGEQLSRVQQIRQQLRTSVINQEALNDQSHALAAYRAGAGKKLLDEFGDARDPLDMLGLPLLMIAFGKRVRDNRPVALLFHPAHISPTEPLEEFKAVLENVVEAERV